MLTVAEILLESFRELNLVPIGTPLTPTQEVEALGALNRYIDSLVGYEFGEFIASWPAPPSTTSPERANFPLNPRDIDVPVRVWQNPPGNVNLLINIAESTKIFLPQLPNDGALIVVSNLAGASVSVLTLDGNGHLIKGAKTLAGTPSALNGTKLFYREDLGDWRELLPLLLTDTTTQFPGVYDQLFIFGTAARLAPRFGRELSADQRQDFRRLRRRAKAQYAQFVEVPPSSPAAFTRPQSSSVFGRLESRGNLF